MTLPAGFRLEHREDRHLLVNEGPKDTAAGQFGDVDPPALWSRQVLTDGQLRAVAVVPPVAGTEPERFQSVHATAEHVADELGVGAVEVAVCWAASMDTRQALRLTSSGWAVAGVGTAGSLVLLVTDAVLEAEALRSALAKVWPPTETVLVLASGASGGTPDETELAATLSALRVDLACTKGRA